MTKSLILKILKYVISLLLGIIIIYFLFRNQDPVKLIEEVQKVKVQWVIWSMIFGSLAYVIRGLRWIILIKALGCSASKINSIAAVSIGYFTNLFIPRAGEISRCTSLYQAEKVPVDKLFGTILMERIIDFIALISLFLLTLIIKFDDIIAFYNKLQEQQTGNTKEINNILLLGTVILAALLCYLIFKWLKKSKFYALISSFIQGFKAGFKSINDIENKKLFWGYTLAIWVMYFLMTYVCFFSMNETAGLSISDGIFLLVLGGVGMVIPTPGGIGSYHAIVMIGLSVLGVGTIYLGENGDTTNPALIFPTIVHVAQTLVAIIMGSLGLLILFLSKKKSNVSS